ncbi:MAG TPA: MFS transporter [Smithellaceae bacterium]|nr:MFS transporter [Smithellaceae bacterium]
MAGVMFAYGSICGNVTYAFGVFLPSIGQTYGWSRSMLSAPYTLFLTIGGILSPVVGFTVARFGARKNIVVGNIVASLGLLGMSLISEIRHIHLFFGIMCGVGMAFSEYLSTTTVITNWFVEKRSLALGLLFASGGASGLVMPPLISFLIATLGWRQSWVCLAGFHLFLGVVLAGWLIRNTPEEMGQTSDGIAVTAAAGTDPGVESRVNAAKMDWSVRDALLSPVLWVIVALFSLLIFVYMMLVTHQVAYLQDLGYKPMVSASALGLMLGMSILGRLISGFLGMRIDGRYLAIAFLAIMGLGVVSLINAQEAAFVYAYSALTGVGFGGMLVIRPNLIGAYFGRANFSRIVGWTAPVATIAGGAGPLFAGFLFDLTGGYRLPLSIAAALLFGGCVLSFFLRPPAVKKDS